jgi:hypothetical protein
MTPGKKQRLANAIGFISGLLAVLGVVRDRSVIWPPDALWQQLRGPQRLQLGGGIALILVTFVISIVRRSED